METFETAIRLGREQAHLSAITAFKVEDYYLRAGAATVHEGSLSMVSFSCFDPMKESLVFLNLYQL